MIKVALVDDHQLFRKSLSLLLSSCEGISVVYDTSDGMAFLKYLEEAELDVLLLDLEMPIVHGYDVCKQAKFIDPDLKVIILSQLTSKEAVHQVRDAFFPFRKALRMGLQTPAHHHFSVPSQPSPHLLSVHERQAR